MCSDLRPKPTATAPKKSPFGFPFSDVKKTNTAMTDDAELLRRYAEQRSESAFAELVQRHLDLVYAAALRRLNGDTHRASDVTQHVFIALARHAASLSRRPVLASWLHTATRHAAIDLIRRETRRASREQHAHATETVNAPATPATDWEKLRPVLDEAIDELPDRDRASVLLRFFENQSFAQLGTKLSLNEDAARMRTNRALEKLRELLARRGVTSTATALGATLAAQPLIAAPTGLAAIVTGATFTAASLAGTTTLATGAFTLMSTKTIFAVAGVLIAVSIGAAVHHARLAERANLALVNLQRDYADQQTKTLSLEARLAESAIVATRSPASQKPAATKASSPETKPIIAVAAQDLMWGNPDYGRKYVEQFRVSIRPKFSLFYDELQLNPAQISKFEKALIEFRQSLCDIWSEAVAHGLSLSNPSVLQLTGEPGKALETNLRAVLGDSGFERYNQYEKEAPSRDLVAALAGNVYFSEAPLSKAQGETLAQLISSHRIAQNPTAKSTANMLRVLETDWTAVLSEAQNVLLPTQLAALRAMAEQKRLTAEMGVISATALNQKR